MVRFFRRVLVVTTIMTMLVALAAISTSSASERPQVTPRPQVVLTATTCQGNTCQVVDGSGTTVTNWYTQTTAPSAVCTYAKYFENGTVIAESGKTCLKAGGSASANWADPGSFPVGTVLCTSWVGIAGKPCDTIE